MIITKTTDESQTTTDESQTTTDDYRRVIDNYRRVTDGCRRIFLTVFLNTFIKHYFQKGHGFPNANTKKVVFP